MDSRMGSKGLEAATSFIVPIAWPLFNYSVIFIKMLLNWISCSVLCHDGGVGGMDETEYISFKHYFSLSRQWYDDSETD